MPKFSDGQKLTQTEWNRLLGSVPASYVVWKDGSQAKAECLLKNGTDYTTGTDETVIQNVLDAISSGGSIFIKKASYTLNESLLLEPTGFVRIYSDGATITPPSGGHALIVDAAYQQGGPLKEFCSVEGLVFNHYGTKTGKGILIRDTPHVHVTNCLFEYLARGITIYDETTWSEGTTIENCTFEDAAYGIYFDGSGNGTGSFVHSTLRNLYMNLRSAGAGIYVQNDGNISFSNFDNISMRFYVDNVSGIYIQNAEKTILRQIYLESYVTAPSALYGVYFGPNGTGMPVFVTPPQFYGSFTSEIYNPNNKPFNCIGWSNYGSATISDGASYVTVYHHLNRTPTCVLVTSTSSNYPSLFVSSVYSSTFRINRSGTTGVTTAYWYAEYKP